jgi:hypothetical protein
MRNRVVRAAALAVVLVLAASVAVASIPDANGVIHGCRKNSGGALRVIDTDAGQTCMANETALSWSQTGPQGPAGPPGGVSGLHVLSQNTQFPANSPGFSLFPTLFCPTGEVAVSGGFGFSSHLSLAVTVSRPVSPNGWGVSGTTLSDDSAILTVYVTCTPGS